VFFLSQEKLLYILLFIDKLSGMFKNRHTAEIYLHKDAWQLLERYVAQIYRSITFRKLLSTQHSTNANYIISAIIQKFLMDNAERINAIEKTQDIRRSLRAIDSDELRAELSRAARAAYAASTAAPTGTAGRSTDKLSTV